MRAWALALLLLVAACGSSAAPKDTTPLNPTAEANAWIELHNANKKLPPITPSQQDCIRTLYATFDQEHLRQFRPDGDTPTSDPEGDRWFNGLVACQSTP